MQSKYKLTKTALNLHLCAKCTFPNSVQVKIDLDTHTYHQKYE